MKLSTLKTIFNTFYQRTYIPISIMNAQKELCFPKHSPLFNHLDHFDYLITQDEYPIHIINTYQHLLASFQFEEYSILIGPCTLLGAKQEEDDIFRQYETYISTESLDIFTQTVHMLYTLLTHQEIDIKQIPVQYKRAKLSVLNSVEKFEKNLYQRRVEQSSRDSYQFELRFLDYVKNGRKDKIDWIITQMHKTYIVHLADSPLESIKIKAISIITLMTRLAIDNGVSVESSFALSDTLIQNLPHIKTAKDGILYIRYASFEFIQLIQSATKQCSALINQCIHYINTHLYEKITLLDLEELTNHSAVYISSRFKKELNISFSQYLLNAKIEEAKHLLLFTDHSFQEISTLLNFTSQSHFTQRFKKVTNQTPKEFRNKNFQYM